MIMRPHHLVTLLLSTLALGGCVVKDIGTTMEHTVKGDYFLTSEKYEEGRRSFAREVAENPDSALAHYYYGRFLLQDEDVEKALDHLETARTIEPDNPDYQFWTGVAYGGLEDAENEEASYRRALDLDEDHPQALVYLGHVELGKKNYEAALDLYDRALDVWPASPEALYNRALGLHILGRLPEARRAWLVYLAYHPAGAKARRAADYLNLLGDFTYRNHRLGARVITTEKIWFEPFSPVLAPSSYASLDLVAATFGDVDQGTLQVLVFQRNNEELARRKAVNIKDYLTDAFPGLDPDRIGISWFAEPQRVTISGRTVAIDESVSFFVSIL